MGHWGVKSYENDDAADALDAGFERVHGAVYDELMDDRNPLTFDQVQQQLADAETLAAAVAALARDGRGQRRSDGRGTRSRGSPSPGSSSATPSSAWRSPTRLRARAIDWLEHEEIDWDEATVRRLRREKEIALLRPERIRRIGLFTGPLIINGPGGNPERWRDERPLYFRQPDQVMPDVDSLLAGYERGGNWSLGRGLPAPRANVLRFSIEGWPVRSPWLIRRTVGPLVWQSRARPGRMPEGIKLTETRVRSPMPDLDDRAEAEALPRSSLQYYTGHSDPLSEHPFFGRSAARTGIDFTACTAHHLSFLGRHGE